VGKLLSLVCGFLRLLMPFLFNRDLAHRSLPDVLKAGWWAKIAPIKLSKGPFGSSPKNQIKPTADFKTGPLKRKARQKGRADRKYLAGESNAGTQSKTGRIVRSLVSENRRLFLNRVSDWGRRNTTLGGR
jgi:hypothetical protein